MAKSGAIDRNSTSSKSKSALTDLSSFPGKVKKFTNCFDFDINNDTVF